MAPTRAFDHETLSSYPEAKIFSAPSSAVNFGPGHLRVESQTYLDISICATPRKLRSFHSRALERGNLIYVDRRDENDINSLPVHLKETRRN